MNTSTFADTIVLLKTQPVPLLFLIMWGIGAVGGFLVAMPLAGNIVATLWLGMIGEQAVAKVRGQETGTDMGS